MKLFPNHVCCNDQAMLKCQVMKFILVTLLTPGFETASCFFFFGKFVGSSHSVYI
jgi:hypothetical protein